MRKKDMPETDEQPKKKKGAKKAWIFVLIVFVLIVLMAMCSSGGKDKSSTEPAQETKPAQENTEAEAPAEETAAATEEPVVEQAPEEEAPTDDPVVEEEPAAPADSGDVGDYYIEIGDAYLTQDYQGAPAIVITYKWTNNSEETKNAAVAVIEKAFQDGVQLDNAVIIDGSYDSGTSLKDARPGATVEIQNAYLLTSDTSEVEFEISELITFVDTGTVYKTFDVTSIS